MNRNRSAGVAAALLLLGGASSALAGDYVQKKDGSFQPPLKSQTPSAQDYEASSWNILDANLNQVSYQLTLNNRPINQKMNAAEVSDIWLAPERYPPRWKDASDALAGGDYGKAYDLFKSIGDDKQVHAVVRQKALLSSARALVAADGGDRVNQAYDYLLKSFPETFYARSAWKDRASYWMDKGDETQALDALKKLLQLPGVSDSDKLEARLLQNTVAAKKAAASKDAAALQKCLDEYKAIGSDTNGKPDLVDVNRMARLGMGSTLLEIGNAKEAKGLFQEISESAQENGILAAAFNGLGECWYRQGNPEGFAEARLCFLRTVTMYSEGSSPDHVAKALYYAGDCFYRLQDSDDWAANAKRELDDCQRRFPKSAWATKARTLKLNIK